jgi:putative peptidoglycan lipid II flippase
VKIREKAAVKFSTQGWVSASLILVAVAMASKGLGFIREVLIANYFGVSAQVDAFMVAMSLPMLIGGGIGLAFSTALVPMYQKVLAKDGPEKGKRLVGAVILSSTGLSLLVMLPLVIAPRTFIGLAAPSLPEETAQLTASITPWLSLYIVGLNLVYILSAVYYAFHHFKTPAFSDLVFNGVAILALVIFVVPFGIQALVFGHLFGILFCIGILAAFLVKGQLARFGGGAPGADLQSFLFAAAPMLLLEVSSQLSSTIENYFASGLTEGSIAALTYAKRVSATVVTLVALNVARGVFPTLSALKLEQKHEEATAIFLQLNKQLVILFVPLAVFFIAFRDEILSLIYLRGAFDVAALQMTSTVFLFYAAGLVIAVIEPVLIRACYAFSDTTTPLVSMALSLFLMVPMAYIMTPSMGVAGIALAVNLALLLRVLILAVSLQNKLNELKIRKVIGSLLTSLVCALIAWLPVIMLQRYFLKGVIVLMPLFFILYCCSAWLFMEREVRAMGRVATPALQLLWSLVAKEKLK